MIEALERLSVAERVGASGGGLRTSARAERPLLGADLVQLRGQRAIVGVVGVSVHDVEAGC